MRWEVYWYISVLWLVVWGRSGVRFQVGQGSSLLILISIYWPHRNWTPPPTQFLIYHLGAPSFLLNSSCKNVGFQKWTELPWKDAALECGWYSGTQIPLAPALHPHFMNHTDADKQTPSKRLAQGHERKGWWGCVTVKQNMSYSLNPNANILSTLHLPSPLPLPALPCKSQCDTTTGHPCNVC